MTKREAKKIYTRSEIQASIPRQTYAFEMFHLAISLSWAELKRDLFRFSREARARQ